MSRLQYCTKGFALQANKLAGAGAPACRNATQEPSGLAGLTTVEMSRDIAVPGVLQKGPST